MKVNKSFLEKLVTEELAKILGESDLDDISSAESEFRKLLDTANLDYYTKDGKFYLTLPFSDPKNIEKDPEMRQRSVVVIDVIGFGTNESEIDI